MFRAIALSLILVFTLTNIAAAAHVHNVSAGQDNAPLSVNADTSDKTDSDNDKASHCRVHCWHHHMSNFAPDYADATLVIDSHSFKLASETRPEAPVFDSKKPPRL